MSQSVQIILAAVEPLRADAIARAEQRFRNWVARIEAELDAVGNDLQAYAPHPHFTDGDYKQKLAFRDAVKAIVTRKENSLIVSRRRNDPEIVSISAEKVERFVRDARENASASFDAYAAKLAGKVGEIRSASICGASLWNGSLLTVETEAGTSQRWHTQQIINVSSLGKVFSQWPTRLRK